MNTIEEQNANLEQQQHRPKNRIPLYDNLRGIFIAFTLLISFMRLFEFIPYWLKHIDAGVSGALVPDGIYIPDVGVPFYLFLMSFFCFYNYRKDKEKLGFIKALSKIFVKACILITAGFVYNVVENMLSGKRMPLLTAEWTFLIMYGVVLLFAMAFVKLKPLALFITGICLMLSTSVLFVNVPFFAESVLSNNYHGIFGVIGWLGLFLVGGAIGEYTMTKNRKMALILSGIVVGLGLIFGILGIFLSNPYFVINKAQLSTGFLFVVLAIAVFITTALSFVKPFKEKEFFYFNFVGKNSLIIFLGGCILAEAVLMVLDAKNNPSTIAIILAIAVFVSVIVTAPNVWKILKDKKQQKRTLIENKT